ncbi:unnamed protein product [Sphagnum jensenii]|uniref:Homeobox domain-containing protein n=1 Tax=Sphagnum jensenii TaxID=128206 RepID=A0ABP1AT87_9BRYO
MESEAKLCKSLEFVGQQVRVQASPEGHLTPPANGSTLPQPLYASPPGQVIMTDEQLETLRRQISVYATICQQLVEMHKASLANQPPPLPGIIIGGQHLSYDQMGTPNHKPTTRLRWSPSQIQLQILERLFEQGNGTPSRQHIKEITDELRRHGQIGETNVYNWFQNRKARAKRRHQQVSLKDGESEAETDVDSPRQKRLRCDVEVNQNNSETFVDKNGVSSDGGNQDENEQNPEQMHHCGQPEDTVTSVLLQEAEIKHNISFISGGLDPHSFTQGATESSMVKMVDDNSKPWQAPVETNGVGTLLGNSVGQLIPSGVESPLLNPVQIEERYSLAGGPVPSMDKSRKWAERG